MIVVIGSPVLQRDTDHGDDGPIGVAARVAQAAAAANRAVQLVGKVGDDDAGDALLIALSAGGVGHAALLRDAAHATPVVQPATAGDDDPFPPDDAMPAMPAGLPLDAGDVQLALRYLTDFQVVVLAGPLDAATVDAAIEAAGFAGAQVIRIERDEPGGTEPVAPVDPNVTVFGAPSHDEPAFAAMVGRYAAGLDSGRAPRDAFAEATKDTSWARAAGD